MDCSSESKTTEGKLKNHLLCDYDTDIRPLPDKAGERLYVNFKYKVKDYDLVRKICLIFFQVTNINILTFCKFTRQNTLPKFNLTFDKSGQIHVSNGIHKTTTELNSFSLAQKKFGLQPSTSWALAITPTLDHAKQHDVK